MDLEETGIEKCRSDQRNKESLPHVLVFFSSAIVSFATSSICIALVALYHQTEAILIVIAASTIVNGLASAAFSLRLKKSFITPMHSKLLKGSTILVQLITMGAAVDYFNVTRKRFDYSKNELHDALLISLDSLLLFSLFISGVAIGIFKIAAHQFGQKVDIPDEKDTNYQYAGKFVPTKNSAQTLTPSIDFFQSINQQGKNRSWNLSDLPVTVSSDEISFPSVVKHKLSRREVSTAQSISRKDAGSTLTSPLSSPKRKNSFRFKLGSFKGTDKTKSEYEKGNRKDVKSKNIDDRYVTRLSTIPDLSKSVLNFINSSSADAHSYRAKTRKDKTASQFTDTSQIVLQPPEDQETNRKITPAMELERDAIERINSALLPPCLSVIETPPSFKDTDIRQMSLKVPSLFPKNRPSSDASIQMSPDILERHDLGDIPRIPAAHENCSNFSSDLADEVGLPQMLTLDMWENNKSSILQRAEGLQEKALAPAFQFVVDKEQHSLCNEMQAKLNFSYPSKSKREMAETSSVFGNNDCDTISAVEDYFNDIIENDEEVESQLIEDGLKQEQSSSFVIERTSKELIRTSTRHSPTKSIISIISGNVPTASQRTQHKRGGYLTGSGDMRSLSQANHFLSNSSNAIISSTAKSSPTRSQRLKKIGKKLSISNISDTMLNHSMNLEGTHDNLNSGRLNHQRGKSIDFSYVHTLQHSPTKSANGSSFKDRRHSLAIDNGFRTTSSLFSLHNGKLRSCNDAEEFVETNSNDKSPEIRDSGDASSQSSVLSSNGSNTIYPEVVMSEYDRERWATLISLSKIEPATEVQLP